MAVSSTTHSSQVTTNIRPILLSESLITRPSVLRWANSNIEKPQIRPSISMNPMASAMRNTA